MSEQRQKSHAVLLRTEGKAISLELFDSREWPDAPGGEGLFRVRVGERWHCPTGKYSFLTLAAVGELVASLLAGGALLQEEDAPYLPYKAEVSVYLDGEPLNRRGWVHAPPHQERDGRWWVWVWLPGGPRKVPVADVTLRRIA